MSGWLLKRGPASDSSMGVLVVGPVTMLVDRRIDESFFPRGFPELSSSSEWPAGTTGCLQPSCAWYSLRRRFNKVCVRHIESALDRL